ncbi:MAG: ribonuclease H-like domain-containing protein [Bacillota bacterium]
MSLKNKLNRLKKHVIREENEPITKEVVHDPVEQLWKEHLTAVFSYDDQKCLIREVSYPLDFQHGHYQLGEFHRIVSMWNESDSTHPLSCKGHAASDLFFFDTETTGLGGGAGNTIFLLGQAQVFPDRVVVKQHLLHKPGNEVALYQSFLQGINSKTLVTYNGKAFDWPQVKTRHTLIRESVPSLPAFGHFDLFHAARRLWKNELESVRLSNVETEILNITRENDIPGFLAPMIYFQFVKQQQPEIIMGVLKHNEIDVLSLITLYIHVSLKLLKTNHEASEAEHFEIARWLDYVGDKKSAFTAYQSLMEKGTDKEAEAKFALAIHYKKQKEWNNAIAAWKEIINSSSNEDTSRKASIELAKYYEHKEKNFEYALYYSELVYKMIKEREHVSLISEMIDVEKRITRLKRKYSENIARGSAKSE